MTKDNEEKTYSEVEFLTVDGLKLRGRLYLGEANGPALVMAHGFNAVKEIVIPWAAEVFQKNGISVLLFDPRNYGESEGMPRQEVDPEKQIEDYFDAVTFLRQQPGIDPEAIGLWGVSTSGATAIGAACFDKRVRLIISVCPLIEATFREEMVPDVMAQIIREREALVAARTAGQQSPQPTLVPMINQVGVSPMGFNAIHGKNFYEEMPWFKETAPNFRPHTTTLTYYKMLRWHPLSNIRCLSPTPIQMLIPGKDDVCPTQEQLDFFEALPGPKRMEYYEDRNHHGLLLGSAFEGVMEAQVRFVQDVLAGKFALKSGSQ
ncbi:hypothetical protein ASPACDRAFT_78840 [Aspergillus aculeatus ATCC 16872]|uniref:Thiohydrolase aneE n=1 Tax=Aspergillus aculeatus (strain ATCC 16872 / CBS 172.66 / WB 5094) TaxID=690307 RepID=ANEE_ASPA1|nr:uncharacterized protein ASPACDRAFT_78840 [Aspergillus aculeatus ATCC 16872]A0A1L9WUI4.1 RecName: Full=Thiohydrolase aneE; AltName: Full=Aculenes biosynthesis cluster protein E [Aspergillus aculeatus ATCC 16872]OJJ99916.1 hypothetical protein ASPACDRAFT_78840 [Aspergillus aculeatus ATCC 16872]